MLGSSRERDREKRQKEHLLTLFSLHTEEERRGKKDRKKVAQICSKVVKRFCDVTKKRQACLASTSDFFAADASLKRLAKNLLSQILSHFFAGEKERESWIIQGLDRVRRIKECPERSSWVVKAQANQVVAQMIGSGIHISTWACPAVSIALYWWKTYATSRAIFWQKFNWNPANINLFGKKYKSCFFLFPIDHKSGWLIFLSRHIHEW